MTTQVAPAAQSASPQQLAAAYAQCRIVARARARNFYYSFVALPAPRRNAICAVYAFMRMADDISDEPTAPLEQRRQHMAQWMAAWKHAEAGGSTDDAVFIALRDAMLRFRIPSKWIDQLVEGTTLDLNDTFPVYNTMAELERYCYLVASVVGLVCIRIFGYQDPAAEQLAELTGIAFQLTNILRDVAEDAAMGRVYVPEEVLASVGLSRADVLGNLGSAQQRQLQQAMAQMGARATELYRAADQLLPLIDADSRPALEVLVSIYHRLLIKIQARGYDVFSERIAVPSRTKLTILAGGLAKVFWRRAMPFQS